MVAGSLAPARAALFLGPGVTAALDARSGATFLATKKAMPASVIAVLAVVGVGLTVAAIAATPRCVRAASRR
ncbi:MAG: hypothetical protein KF850_14200 [Labilithrix sp.]|nr:hypothetical protein [Labilithrix sp.]